MKLILIILLSLIILIIWSILCPDYQITIKAITIKKLSTWLFDKMHIWANNRLQTHRLRQSLVQQETMLAHSQQLPILSSNSEQHQLAAKAFKRTIILQFHGKTRIIIPTETFILSKFILNELDDCLIDLLDSYYPYRHWQPLIIKRTPLINYFYIVIREK